MATNTIARSLNDLGLAGWFGSSLMGAVAVNRAPADVPGQRDRSRVANGVWRRWWPAQAACMAASATGGIGLTVANRGRVAAQPGVARTAAAKAVLLGVAGAATAWSEVLGKRIDAVGATPIEDATTPAAHTDEAVAAAQRQLAVLQWAIPAALGVILVLDARLGEQQRPSAVSRGLAARLRS